jgi:hypothetical protein
MFSGPDTPLQNGSNLLMSTNLVFRLQSNKMELTLDTIGYLQIFRVHRLFICTNANVVPVLDSRYPNDGPFLVLLTTIIID